jgi:Cu-processing system permease protein
MRNVMAIAISTFRESVRNKIVYSVFFFLAILLGGSALFGSVTMGDEVVVIKDFGLFAMSFFTAIYAVIAGGTLLFRELTNRTVYNLLSKAVHRQEFLYGKFLGLFSTGLFLIFTMTPVFLAFVACFEKAIDWSLLLAIYTMVLQLMIVSAFAIFFSSIVVTPFLVGAFTFAMFFVSRSSGQILRLAESDTVPASTAYLLKGMYYALPHLDSFDLIPQVLYKLPIASGFFAWSTTYTLAYSALLLSVATFLFKKRDL